MIDGLKMLLLCLVKQIFNKEGLLYNYSEFLNEYNLLVSAKYILLIFVRVTF